MWRLFSLSLLNLTQPWKFVIAPLGSTVASTASILSTSSTITGMHEAAGGRQPATAKPPLYVPGTTNMQRPKTFRSSAVTLTVLYYRIYICRTVYITYPRPIFHGRYLQGCNSAGAEKRTARHPAESFPEACRSVLLAPSFRGCRANELGKPPQGGVIFAVRRIRYQVTPLGVCQQKLTITASATACLLYTSPSPRD